MKQTKIVKLNRTGELGTLLQASESEGGKTHFYPAGMGQYRASEVSGKQQPGRIYV